ncbi:MAG: hypothetical protein ABJH68_07380 [Ilumatobacter sp.]|uniref:HNH endonuclease n=1 Tax=Ilumatobacter sp. TaxID=1967498 RepID=UPI003296CA0C
MFTSAIYPAEHWADSSREARYADVEWDCLLDPADRLPVEQLITVAPGVPWNRLQGSGVSVPTGDLTALEERWSGHVGHLPYVSPEEGSGELFSEGRRTRVVVNRYERDRNARAACLDHYGFRCQACDLDFSEMYGEIGEGFIHVHHVNDIALAETEYMVDPIADLRPVCPNCHAMLHKASPAMTVQQLKKHLAKEARRV